jgi:hypothetical protein
MPQPWEIRGILPELFFESHELMNLMTKPPRGPACPRTDRLAE